MPRPVHFDITAENPDRAVSFYEQAFGWKFNHWGGGGPMDYWLIDTGETQPGIAAFTDTEGNRFGLMQSDEAAG